MNNWIVPCNLKFFDIVNRFKEMDTVVWKRGNIKMKNGDTVYIYVGNPLKEIKYKCCIINDNVTADILEENKYAKVGDYEHNHKYMELRLIHEYSNGVPLDTIKALGIYMIRKQSRLDSRLEEYLDTIDESIN